MVSQIKAELDEERKKALMKQGRKREPDSYVSHGNLDMYSDEALQRRDQLSHNQTLLDAIERWWTMAVCPYFDRDNSGDLDEEEYCTLHIALNTVLCEEDVPCSTEEAAASAHEDWIEDSGGDGKV